MQPYLFGLQLDKKSDKESIEHQNQQLADELQC